MMLSILLFFVSLFLIWKNSMFYSVSLILVSILVSLHLVFQCFISVLVSIMFIIVYVGAMMILVGYICAVTPNLYLEPDYNLVPFLFIFVVFSTFFNYTVTPYSGSANLVDFFYSPVGFLVFCFLVFTLFLVLLMVTTHDNSPRGPFRSLL